MQTLSTEYGDYDLERSPPSRDNTLRAWDAADELLLAHLHEHDLLLHNHKQRILIINDNFGALACAVAPHRCVSWSDSKLSHLATVRNRVRNHLDHGPIKHSQTCDMTSESALLAGHSENDSDGEIEKNNSIELTLLPSTEKPQMLFNLILIRIPKSNALLEEQLTGLFHCIDENTTIIAAAMIKHLPKSSVSLLEKYIGKVTTSLAHKKARLLFSQPSTTPVEKNSPYPTYYFDEITNLNLCNHAALFSREQLDIGTRFFLSHYKKLPESESVIDLGCGNGILGIAYQQKYRASTVTFIDESYMAIVSANKNHQQAFPNIEVAAKFNCTNGLEETDTATVQLILCNPPFHQQHVVGEHIAAGMLREAKRCLAPYGELWIVCNRQLSYKQRLGRIFGHCQIIATNRKFTILRAVKRV